MNFDTLCIHAGPVRQDPTGAVSAPIYQSATYAHPGVDRSTGYDYSRLQNPTREHLEQVLAALENGSDAMAFSTGMAAIATMMELFAPGDHIVASNDLYGGSNRLFDHVAKKNGLRFTYADTSRPEALEKAMGAKTRCVFVETPTNPLMKVTDIAAVARICRGRGALLAVDNTFLTPYVQKPLDLGADIVIHSGTKYLGGHNDALAGFLVVARADLSEKLRFLYKTVGACLAPMDSWLMIRGIKTLAVRMDRQQKSAGALARWLEQCELVKEVLYPGLPQHPGYSVSRRQASGFGAMLSFRVEARETARRILERVRVIRYAESLGGVESLITYPMLQTHADIPKEERESKGIDEKLLRLSVGLENEEDLRQDLRQAMKG